MGSFMDYFFGTKSKKSEDEDKKAMDSYNQRNQPQKTIPTAPTQRESTIDEDIQNLENRRKKTLEKVKKAF